MGLVVAVFVTSPASALDPTSRLSQYGHTSWRVQEGEFGGAPQTIAQTPDGYLWVGTTTGLVRFDGNRFKVDERLATGTHPQVAALRVARDGSLWIGRPLEVVHLHGETIERIPISGLANAFAEDANGHIWFVRTRMPEHGALCAIEADAVRCADESHGVPARYADHLAVGRDGALYIGGSDVFVRWRDGKGEPYFAEDLTRYRDFGGTLGLDSAPNGTLTVALPKQHGFDIRSFDGSTWSKAGFDNEPDAIVNALFYDHSGQLWIGTLTNGVYRSDGRTLEHFGSAEGLSGDAINAIFEDAEGDIWIATPGGIDRLRDLPVVSFSSREGLGAEQANVVIAQRDGTVWVGDGQFLDHIDTKSRLRINAERVMAVSQVTSIADAGDGKLWVGADDTLWLRETNGRFTEVRTPDQKSVGTVELLVVDGRGDAWGELIADSGRYFSVRPDGVARFVETNEPRREWLAPSIGDGAWIIDSVDQVSRLRDQGIEPVRAPATDAQAERVQAILGEGDDLFWFATANGLVRSDHGSLQRLTRQQGLPCDAIYALLAAADRGLWLYGACGLVYLSRADIERALGHPSVQIRPKVFDAYDGARPSAADFTPNAALTSDGRAWFANGSIVQMIDPARLNEVKAPPPVHIEGVVADHAALPATPVVSIPARTRDLAIEYSAPSFSAPQRTAFRYKLEGYDQEWQQAGSRRQAFYTGVGPGHYVFSVIASNGGETWTQVPARVDVNVGYAFYETLAFKLLLAALAVATAIVVYRRRIRSVTALAESRLQGKMAERERIARELHDTLLQSIQGLILRVHGAKRKLAPGDPARDELEGALQQADAALVEGRDRVHEMRTGTNEAADLIGAFRVLCGELRALFEMPCEVTHEGAVRALNPATHEEVFWIVREALLNACRHSKGTAVEVHLDYDPRRFVVTIADDGVGADDSVRSEPGHSGLAGMRERARGIGGRFELQRRSPRGTVAALSVPARFAYAAGDRRL